MGIVTFRQIDRVSVGLPLRVSVGTDPVKAGATAWRMDPEIEYTVTENLSPGGCYFYLSQEPPSGARLEMKITIPGETPDVPFARIYCRGRVIRVERASADPISGHARFGVATTIEHLRDVNVESIPASSGHPIGTAIA